MAGNPSCSKFDAGAWTLRNSSVSATVIDLALASARKNCM
jgi:hypothetical protein